MTTADVEPLAYRPKDAARAIGLSIAQLNELIARGEIASIKLGTARTSPRLIRREALVAYLDRLEQVS